VSHLGFDDLGIISMTAAGIQGGILQMVNHGVSTGGLFLVVGMLYERRHTKAMDAYGGIWKALPLLGGLALIITFSSMGLPGLNGFVGEFTILLGTFGSSVLGFFYTLFATLGVILSAIYLLYLFQKIFMGELDKEENKHLLPLHWQEVAVLVPIIIAVFLIGLQPAPFFATMSASVDHVVTQVGPYIPTVARNVAP
jgi:NADH-quinone oxidoreductase subunit M